MKTIPTEWLNAEPLATVLKPQLDAARRDAKAALTTTEWIHQHEGRTYQVTAEIHGDLIAFQSPTQPGYTIAINLITGFATNNADKTAALSEALDASDCATFDTNPHINHLIVAAKTSAGLL